MKCSFSLFQLCFYCKHRGSGQQYVAALFCRLQLEHFNCCLMREHLALSRWPQGLVIPLSTGSVLLVKDRAHIKDKAAVLKGQRMNCSARNHPSPACARASALPHPPNTYTVTFRVTGPFSPQISYDSSSSNGLSFLETQTNGLQ